jgi:hypothetical protein
MPTRRVRIVVPVIQLLLEFALLSRLRGVLRRGGDVALFPADPLSQAVPIQPLVASAATTDLTFT